TGEWGGMAPAARISHGSLWDITGSGTQPSNLYQALSDAHVDGARVHSNSWGDDSTNAYTSWSRDIDMFSYDFEDSLVVQAGTNLSSGRSPENAKNGLTVGASKRGSNAHFRCHGTIGPTSDGRRKPEVLAPGCDIISARAFYSCSTFVQTGTSMATPAVAGVASLVRQYYLEGWYPSGTKTPADALQPSGALVKATLLNSTVDMTGEPGYPTDVEGWGRPLIEYALYFAGDARSLSVIDDVRNADGLTTGGAASYFQQVKGAAETLKVTLVWTEPPAALLAEEATINNLDLEVVSPSGTSHLGNVIDTNTGYSMTGGSADPRNNVEMVIVPSAEAGAWTVRVLGTAINQGTQGYALLASGDVEPYVPYPLEHDSYIAQDDAPLGNQDGIVDPGETVVMPETLRNSGAETASSISGELRVSHPDLVKVTRSAARYPDIPSGAARTTDAPHYRYTVSPDTACGTQLRFDIALSSSAGDGGASFTLEVGCNPLDCTGSPVPADEVARLELEPSGSADLRLSWDPLTDAAGYRVWKSTSAEFTNETFVGSTTVTEFVETDGTSGLEPWFDLVRATNACEWEGP
ncbi:MAG: S8 family serine peptidase, partial [Acidobacteriota bacterium]